MLGWRIGHAKCAESSLRGDVPALWDAMDPPLDSCEHEKRMRDGAVLLGRRVAVAVAAALCLSSLVGVLGAQAAGAALQSKSSVTVTVAVSPPTEVYGVLNQVFSVTVAPPAAGDVSPTGVVTVSDLGVDLCPPITLPAPWVGRRTVICADTTVPIPVNPLTIAEYSYSGDQNYLASKGRVSGAVTAADTTTSVIASSTTGTWGSEQSLVFTATVADSQSGSVGVPTGEVSVEAGCRRPLHDHAFQRSGNLFTGGHSTLSGVGPDHRELWRRSELQSLALVVADRSHDLSGLACGHRRRRRNALRLSPADPRFDDLGLCEWADPWPHLE